MSTISPNKPKKKTNHYHIFFIFHLRNYTKPIVYTKMSWTSEHALYSDIDHIQSAFETLQETCQNKINFTIAHVLTSEENPHNIAEYKDMIIINDVIEDIVEILQKELESNTYDDLPHPAIARKENHLVLGMYANKDIKYNIVANSDLMSNYIYNTIYRFGRLIYTDGIRTYNGCMKDEYLPEYDEKAKQFFEGYGKDIKMSTPTIPYH